MAAIGMEDLFGSQDAKTVVDFAYCGRSRPRYQFDNFNSPQWLRNYEIVHIKRGDNNPVLAKAFCSKRYHMVLDNLVDRMSMSKAVSVGEILHLFFLLPRLKRRFMQLLQSHLQ